MQRNHSPKHIRKIEQTIETKLKDIKSPSSELLEYQQTYLDKVLQVF